jgi:hypothetical protein
MEVDPPLSTAPEELAARRHGFNAMLGLAMILTAVALAAEAWIATPTEAAVVIAILLVLELVQDRASRSERTQLQRAA